MKVLKKTSVVISILTSLFISADAAAATSCKVNIASIEYTNNDVRVRVWDYQTLQGRDEFYLSYQDRNFGSILERLVQAKSNGTPLKIYILEEFNGDDSRSCKDGVPDYIGSAHNI